MDEFNLIFNYLERIFNGDETNFMLCPKSRKVLAPKDYLYYIFVNMNTSTKFLFIYFYLGTRNVYEIDRGKAKENLTVLFSFSAARAIVEPLIIYPYKRLPDNIRYSFPDGLKWSKTDNGWMTSDVFLEYIRDTFYFFFKKNECGFSSNLVC